MFSNVSMQTKILGLVTGLILLVSLLLTVFYAVMEYQRIEQETGEKGERFPQIRDQTDLPEIVGSGAQRSRAG